MYQRTNQSSFQHLKLALRCENQVYSPLIFRIKQIVRQLKPTLQYPQQKKTKLFLLYSPIISYLMFCQPYVQQHLCYLQQQVLQELILHLVSLIFIRQQLLPILRKLFEQQFSYLFEYKDIYPNKFGFIIQIHILITNQMHSFSSRFNGVTLYGICIMALMCGINYLHGYYIYSPNVNSHLQIHNVTNFVKASGFDQASFKYSMDADFSSLYTWNLKQLYVYIQFQWVNLSSNLTSRTIASDWILQLPKNKQDLQKQWTIKVNNSKFDYLIRDVHLGLRGNDVKITLNVQYMPIVGIFFKSRLFEMTYRMPQNYTNQV